MCQVQSTLCNLWEPGTEERFDSKHMVVSWPATRRRPTGCDRRPCKMFYENAWFLLFLFCCMLYFYRPQGKVMFTHVCSHGWGVCLLRGPTGMHSYIFTACKTKFAKVTFLQVSVCPQGCLPHCILGYTPRQTPPPSRHPQTDTHPGQTPPSTVHAGIQSTSGRYASHWNAFLFGFYFL